MKCRRRQLNQICTFDTFAFSLIPPFYKFVYYHFLLYVFHKFQVSLLKMMFVLSNYVDICNKVDVLRLFSFLKGRKVMSFLAFLKKVSFLAAKQKR